ncbi:hypothetical protein A2W14_02075 [Candidatus Gottesmanbacteria bacterium RBG_16_37_8]|uniref:O-antigen ligase-related domain-containing protein n=1 Tax=Candidatus Gottesmanbacteria bacterium RBG_16_37_8 TaxID=1798371 RepID=A0A1F5YS75_9BACT|nr:MAG: hypothetical protein A2W14_02075 [Candidatus Gottesmanbacteria bacterium RBG_16_37_8]
MEKYVKIQNIMRVALLDKIIEISFYLLFFLVPLILTPFNYELFEYNKMMLTYGLTVIIITAWVVKMVLNQRLILKRTPLDIPLFIFLISQAVSTFLSWDRHVSVYGYYSRFNGGLLSTISYILLFSAFTSNFPKNKIAKLIKFTSLSAFLVSIYAVLEHFGIDKNIWVQDVQNRVFSTLGQPNWLAAYLSVLIMIVLGQVLENIKKIDLVKLILSAVFFLTLLFTKSRSGFLGLTFGLIVFWSYQLYIHKKAVLKKLLLINSLFLILIFLFGCPISKINRFTLPQLIKPPDAFVEETVTKPIGSSIIDIGITESATIRNIVWQGSLEIFKNYPLFGTGVETFAYSYFKYRPVEHNMTSEWDFLYNKAHNEFLNYAATSGIFGLGSYLLIIMVFISWFIKYLLRPAASDQRLTTGLFAAWVTIPVTNFFGFSVVIIQLFYFLIPAILILLISSDSKERIKENSQLKIKLNRKIIIVSLFLLGIYLLFRLCLIWLADFYFAKGSHQSKAQEYQEAYKNIKQATLLNNNEPYYKDELAFPAIELGLYYFGENNSTKSAQFINEGVNSNQQALLISPRNVNYWKTRTRILYALTQIDENYLTPAITSLQKAKELSPTDPKIRYNLALLYDQSGDKQKAYQELEETIKLKINYRDAYLAQGVFYTRDNQKEKAKEALNFILKRINPNDEEANKLLEELP